MQCSQGLFRNIDVTMRGTSPEWEGVSIPVFLPLRDNGMSLCGGVVYWSDMPEGLRMCFTQWLESRLLSISMPPACLPRAGRRYFLEDVLAALEYQWHPPHGNA